MSNFLHESMKQNVDSNILFNIQNTKHQTEKQSKSTKRELFREINDNDDQSQKLSQLKPIKKNAYIVDSDPEDQAGNFFRNQGKFNQSIDEVSQIIESLSKQSFVPSKPKPQHSNPITTCSTHHQPINSYNFCIECSSYLMCPLCISTSHSSHMILTFGSQQQTKCFTKQFLIQKIEQTLQKLKSRQNNIKNKTTEIELIFTNVKKMEDELMNKLENVFRQISNIVRNVYDREHILYEKRIDQFYHEYNGAGDELRENLLTIIDQSFDINKFNPLGVSKQPPAIHNQHIDKFKSVLEKTKRFYKTVMDSLDQLKLKTEDMSRLKSTKGANTKKIKAIRQNSTKKYEKFLSESCYQNDSGEVSKSSLIKILDTLSK